MGSRITEQQKLEWQNHFEAQKKSGLTKAKYCRLNNLNVDVFHYHLKKTSEQASKSPSNTAISSDKEFISLVVEPPSTDSMPPPIELSFEHQGQSLILNARWTINELLEFINAWRAS